MEREDIRKYAEECAEDNMVVHGDYPFYPDDYEEYKEAYIKTFNQGVEYADSHPKSPWISVKDDLPCNHKELINPNFKKETLLVLAITPSGYAFFDYMVYTNVWFWKNRNYCHAYWFPIPELPKE